MQTYCFGHFSSVQWRRRHKDDDDDSSIKIKREKKHRKGFLTYYWQLIDWSQPHTQSQRAHTILHLISFSGQKSTRKKHTPPKQIISTRLAAVATRALFFYLSQHNITFQPKSFIHSEKRRQNNIYAYIWWMGTKYTECQFYVFFYSLLLSNKSEVHFNHKHATFFSKQEKRSFFTHSQ